MRGKGWVQMLDHELLADLHAGVLPVDEATRLWPLALADPESAALLAALDATTADLAPLAGAVEPMPELVAARLQRALAAEPTRTQPTTRPTTRRGRRFSVLGATAAAAVVAGIGVFSVGQLADQPSDSSPRAGGGGTVSSTAEQPLEVSAGPPTRDLVLTARGTPLQGRLTDEKVRTDCLQANGYALGTPVLGARQVKVGDRIGTLLVIPGGRAPLIIALVVGDRCSAANPDLLAVNTVTD